MIGLIELSSQVDLIIKTSLLILSSSQTQQEPATAAVATYGLFDFCYKVATAAVGGLLVLSIVYIIKKLSNWVSMVRSLSDEEKKSRERIEMLEKKVTEIDSKFKEQTQ
jgi:hypothetical protein